MKKALQLTLLSALFCSCEPINRYINQADDWWGEELVELGIKAKLGADIDLTPSTPE